jgi:hypothetical protein
VFSKANSVINLGRPAVVDHVIARYGDYANPLYSIIIGNHDHFLDDVKYKGTVIADKHNQCSFSLLNQRKKESSVPDFMSFK